MICDTSIYSQDEKRKKILSSQASQTVMCSVLLRFGQWSLKFQGEDMSTQLNQLNGFNSNTILNQLFHVSSGLFLWK